MLVPKPQNFPTQTQRITEHISGNLHRFGRDFLKTLYDRTGGARGVPSVQKKLTATGSTQVTALLLTGDWNDFGTVAPGAGCQIPKQFIQGSDVTIHNGGTNTLSIYPPPGWQIDALGVNAPYLLPAGKTQVLRGWDNLLIRSTQLG
jgi:hypothetical protein